MSAPNLQLLLYAKWRSVRNGVVNTRGGMRLRILLFALLGGLFWLGTFAAVYWFVDQCQRVEIFGDVLVEQLVSMIFLIVLSVLVFSNLIGSFSAYFLAEDLRFLITRPIRPYAFFTARFIELLLQSSWMVFVFSSPVFLTVGIVYRLGPSFYLSIPVVIIPLMVICTAIASLISFFLTNVLPARRTREILLLLVALLFVVLFVLFRSLQPERFLNPDDRSGIVEILSTFQAPQATFLPSKWAFRALWPDFIGLGDRHRGFFLGCLYSTAIGLFFLSGWAFRALHFNGYSKAQEGRSEGSAPERLFRAISGRRISVAERSKRALAALASGTGRFSFFAEMRRKDAHTFIRDTAQWTQLILLTALIVIYLLNFKYMQTIGEGGIIGPVGLYFCNLGLSGFVITAICVRFVFPSISLEGRSFWLIKSAPIAEISFLRAKWAAMLPGIWLVGQTLTLLSNFMIGAGWKLSVIALIVQTVATVSVVGLGVGLGAVYPRFRANDAVQVATGFGGFLYMVTGVVLNLAVLLLSAYPTLLILGPEASPLRYLGAIRVGWGVCLGAAAVVLPLFVSLLAVRIGARNLAVR